MTDTLGKILDMTDEEFEKYVSRENPSYLMSLKNYLTMTWENVKRMKDVVLDGVSEGQINDSKETANTLTGLYEQLFNIERKATLIQKVLDQKTF